jgi:hypothetical protein
MTDHNTPRAKTKIRCSNPTCESHTVIRHGKQVATLLVDLRDDGTVMPFNINHAQCNYCGSYRTMAPFNEGEPTRFLTEYRFFVDARVAYRVRVVTHDMATAKERVRDCLMDSDDEPAEFIEWLNLDDPEFVEASPVLPAPAVTE